MFQTALQSAFRHLVPALPLAAALAAATPAAAGEIRVACYSDGNECEVTEALAQRFMTANADVRVVVDKVPYKTILEGLPVQLAAGHGPDIARVTDFGTFAKFYLDLRPHLKNAAYWETQFGPTLDWFRAGPDDRGIYGLMTQLTVSAPIVNKTLFEQANVPLPPANATWEQWVAATRQVARATGVPFAMAWDRSGHRFAGPAISMGAKYFDGKGQLAPVDAGFRLAAERFVGWHKDGTMPREVWGGQGGGGYKDAFEDFANARTVLYLSGSWQVQRLEKQVGNGFDWAVVPNPCGEAACSGMPGGAGFVAFKGTKNPGDVARFLDYLASEPVYAEWMSKTANIPAHLGLQKKGIDYTLSPMAAAAMGGFVANAATLSPVAYKLQGHPYSRVALTATATRLGQAIVGEITVDQALDRIAADVRDQLAAAKAN